MLTYFFVCTSKPVYSSPQQLKTGPRRKKRMVAFIVLVLGQLKLYVNRLFVLSIFSPIFFREACHLNKLQINKYTFGEHVCYLPWENENPPYSKLMPWTVFGCGMQLQFICSYHLLSLKLEYWLLFLCYTDFLKSHRFFFRKSHILIAFFKLRYS